MVSWRLSAMPSTPPASTVKSQNFTSLSADAEAKPRPSGRTQMDHTAPAVVVAVVAVVWCGGWGVTNVSINKKKNGDSNINTSNNNGNNRTTPRPHGHHITTCAPV